jgi:hypothetical protein
VKNAYKNVDLRKYKIPLSTGTLINCGKHLQESLLKDSIADLTKLILIPP